MCTGKCTMCVGISLIPLAVLAILGNALMFFPNGAVDHIFMEEPTARITVYALFLGGIGGGGILVLLSAMQMICAGLKRGCCANRCGMLMSVLFSVVGLAGSGYCLAVSTVGLIQGPKCNVNSTSEEWIYPFEQHFPNINQDNVHSYLFNSTLWDVCLKPPNAVKWHVALFTIVAVTGAVQVLLCAVQFVNGFLGVLCGTCRKEKAAKNQLPLTRM
ncbi:transmembrane 4 L6 family member 5-like isoform X2 [Lethenteron reissneri]|uniref:transmembrane 4 L6 family member 5-like isoform X2 n=1 Tax=Lethenteron reissneri TaxID=7753 RepID=UPI002AB66D32|nr:transmembrane 4 L6 family member 5-like isoform X2 [Lethenteron reissneri]